MSILETVEASLRQFRPKTYRQFVAFNVASRFDDLPNLARYLNVCDRHPKNVQLEAARLAEQRARTSNVHPAELYFALLEDWGKEAA